MEISKLKTRVTIHDEEQTVTRLGNGAGIEQKTESASHGGFNNYVKVITSRLVRITGAPLAPPVDDLVGF